MKKTKDVPESNMLLNNFSIKMMKKLFNIIKKKLERKTNFTSSNCNLNLFRKIRDEKEKENQKFREM
jgi:hypothetical protein